MILYRVVGGLNAKPILSPQKEGQLVARCLGSGNAVLTPRIVREGVSGVLSAQWSSRDHWMEVCLHSHNLTIHR